MMPRAPLWATLMLVTSVSHAETSYVIDQLVVSVTATQESDSERVGQVKSGDKLEVLEREGDETHVKLSNGRDGWLKSSYLANDPPLQTRFNERTAEIEKLKQEGEKQRQESDKVKQDVTRLQAELAAARAAHNATSDAPPPPAPVHDSVFLQEPARPSATPWPLLLGVAAAMLLVGFVAGWTTLDRKIRRRYGGLKIY
jgi:Bacterial SH3 domain